MDRIILHCDLNNYFASVECLKNSKLKSVPVAICGSAEERHGIVLAKNYPAKAFGVQTGEAIWQAKQKCPSLVVLPPHYDEYLYYSRKVKHIYENYTDIVEPFGIDECWLDVTGSTQLFGTGSDIANSIKETVKSETGLTISAGVSFNKIFAKLGSDMKKPDAITIIEREDFRKIVWPLPAADMLGVGKRSAKALFYKGCRTIGDIAACGPQIMSKEFGKNGKVLWTWASGLDASPVVPDAERPAVKSVGHGITANADLVSSEEVCDIITELSEEVGMRLRKNLLSARGVSLGIRDCTLSFREYQSHFKSSTQSTREIAEKAKHIFASRHIWNNNIRSITVRAIDLCSPDLPEQLDIYNSALKRQKIVALESAVDGIREKHGMHSVCSCSYLKDLKLKKDLSPSDEPIIMFNRHEAL